MHFPYDVGYLYICYQQKQTNIHGLQLLRKKKDVCQASGPSENSTISPADKQIEVIKINKGKGFTKIFSNISKYFALCEHR